MELDLEKIEATQRTFNQKYGVDFDIGKYDRQLRGLAENSVVSENSQNDWNTEYRSEFVKLMKRAFTNFVDFKISKFDPKEMLNDFETFIMEPYRAECTSKKASCPSKNAGWSDKNFYERVQHEFKDIPNHKWDFARERYLNEELRVRDIRAYRGRINNEPGFLNKNTLSTLMCYKRALEHAVNKRSRWFRIRHPFKSSAEKRELKEVIDCIGLKTGGTFDPLVDDETRDYIEADQVSEDKTIENLKAEVSNKLENIQVVNNEKTSVIVDSLNVENQMARGNNVSEPIINRSNDKTVNNPSKSK